MKREEGFYWVEQTPMRDWEVMRWDGIMWTDTWDCTYQDNNLHQINEERIKTPDER